MLLQGARTISACEIGADKPIFHVQFTSKSLHKKVLSPPFQAKTPQELKLPFPLCLSEWDSSFGSKLIAIELMLSAPLHQKWATPFIHQIRVSTQSVIGVKPSRVGLKVKYRTTSGPERHVQLEDSCEYQSVPKIE